MDLPAHDLPGNRDGAPLEPTFAIHPDYLYGDAAQGAGEVNQIDADALGRTSDQFIRYRALTYRLVAPAEAVDPAQALDEQFSATDVVAQLPSRPTGSSRSCRSGSYTLRSSTTRPEHPTTPRPRAR